MKHKSLFLFLFLLTIVSCNPANTNTLDKELVGKWSMEKVFEYEKDVTEIHNPKGDRWIEFHADGSFVSDGEPFGRNTGHWETDNAILYIDSDVDDDDSEWTVVLQGDQLTWTGIGHPRKENTKLIHKKME